MRTVGQAAFIKVMDQSQREINASDFHCRICLEPVAELSLYCDCRSHLAAVHQQCLITHLQYKIQKKRQMSCQICKSLYNVQSEQQHLRLCKTKVVLTVLLIVFGLISFAVAILCYLLISRVSKADREIVLQTLGWIAVLMLSIILYRLGKTICKYKSERVKRKVIKQVQPKLQECKID